MYILGEEERQMGGKQGVSEPFKIKHKQRLAEITWFCVLTIGFQVAVGQSSYLCLETTSPQ